jgi:ubiquitin carboxyl-terminal hydrolase 25/28
MTYVADAESSVPLPDYGAPDTIPIEAVPPNEADETPALISDDGWQVNTKSQWDNNGWGTNQDWDENTESWYSSVVLASDKVTITNRDKDEEKNWWDQTVIMKAARPGAGFTAPLLSDRLHEGDHTLFSVSVSQPNIPPIPAVSSQDAPARPPGLHNPQWTPPTDDEVRMAIPHPNAFYCRAENSWVLMFWNASSVLPPFTDEFLKSAHPLLPNASLRNSQVSCLDSGDKKKNFTHHFHLYEKAVDSSRLPIPYISDNWNEHQKSDNDMDIAESPKGELLDVFICCQCQFYCMASSTIPGVISKEDLNAFVADRSQPPVGKSSEESIIDAFGTLIK